MMLHQRSIPLDINNSIHRSEECVCKSCYMPQWFQKHGSLSTIQMHGNISYVGADLVILKGGKGGSREKGPGISLRIFFFLPNFA